MASVSHPIRTKLTEMLGIKSPIVGAPMGYAWSADLAYAVTSAGGFGMTGAALDGPAAIRERLSDLRRRFKVPPGKPIPIGFGLIGWVLDKTENPKDPRVPAILDEMPVAIMFAFGDDLGKYVRQVRDHEANKAHKTLVFVCVNSVEEALTAVNEWKVDVLVAQGVEAGGHGSSRAPSTSILTTAILAAFPNGPPVVAAGGIATGAQAASLLTLGASGIMLGTRLLFTHECQYTPDQKAAILGAGLNSTARGLAFDEMYRLTEWPEGIDGHAIANGIWKDYEEGLPLEERLRRYDEAKVKGEKDRLVVWAGAAVGLTKEIKSAADVLIEVHDEAIQHIRKVSALL